MFHCYYLGDICIQGLVDMRFWLPLLVAAAIAGSFWLAVADSAAPPSKIPARVKKLERQVAYLTERAAWFDDRASALEIRMRGLEGRVTDLERNQGTAAQAEDGLRVRIEKLEQAVFGK